MENAIKQQKAGNNMNDEPMTLREIAESEGVSHQAIAEVLERALKKVQKAFEAKGIKKEDLL